MTRWQHKAYRMRRLILIMGVAYVAAALGWMLAPYWRNDNFFIGLLGTPLTPGALVEFEEFGYAVNLVLMVGLLLIAQWAFLRPGSGFTVRLTDHGRPLKTAVISAGVMAMLLTTGGIALLMELPDWWQPTMEAHDGKGIFYIWGGMLLIWVVWATLFLLSTGVRAIDIRSLAK